MLLATPTSATPDAYTIPVPYRLHTRLRPRPRLRLRPPLRLRTPGSCPASAYACGVRVQRSKDRLVHASLLRLWCSTYKAASSASVQVLVGGYKVGDILFYTAESQTFPSGTKLVHGQQGKVTGRGDGKMKHTHLTVLFPGNKRSVGLRPTDVSREPPLPSGYQVGETVFYTAARLVRYANRTEPQLAITLASSHGQRVAVCAPLTPVSHPGVWLAGAEKVGPPSHSTCSHDAEAAAPPSGRASSRRLSQLPPPGGEPDPPERHQDGARPAGQGDGARYWRQEAHAREGALHSPNYTCCAIRCIRCLPIVHTTAVCLSNLKVLFSGNTKSIGCRANDVRRPLAHPSFRPPYPPHTRGSGHEPSGQPPATAQSRGGWLWRGTVKGGRRGWEGSESRRGSLEAEPTAYFTVWELQCHMCTGITKVQLGQPAIGCAFGSRCVYLYLCAGEPRAARGLRQ
jgi:hypothetical protein